MARFRLRFPENVPGEFFVERSCIDCDTCRQLAPEVFARRADSQSFVCRQPVTGDERRRALMALVACPSSAIGTTPKAPDIAEGISAFPARIDGDVYDCGYASGDTFGATTYFLRREQGNVLIDSPRAAAPLMKRMEEWGGVRTMFLSHRDDVAHHAAFHHRFGCERVIHERDALGAGLEAVERRLGGDDPVALADDLLAIPVPGHTAGSTALLFQGRYLFTGDHLWWSEDERGLVADRNVCWHSWKEQLQSLRRLLDFEFEWVLPGHGRRFAAGSPGLMRAQLERLLKRLTAAR